jgi:hypothetical protein
VSINLAFRAIAPHSRMIKIMKLEKFFGQIFPGASGCVSAKEY